MHFYGKGIPLDQVPFGQFFFHKPLLLDIPKEPGAKLMPEDLIPHREDVKDADLLFNPHRFLQIPQRKTGSL